MCARACSPGGPHASRSRPGSRQTLGGSAAAHSSPAPPPPPRCGTVASHHDCPCSQERLPAPAESAGGHKCVRRTATDPSDAELLLAWVLLVPP